MTFGVQAPRSIDMHWVNGHSPGGGGARFLRTLSAMQ